MSLIIQVQGSTKRGPNIYGTIHLDAYNLNSPMDCQRLLHAIRRIRCHATTVGAPRPPYGDVVMTAGETRSKPPAPIPVPAPEDEPDPFDNAEPGERTPNGPPISPTGNNGGVETYPE